MQVILLERIEKLGQMGDVVNVKPGFARNFLLPRKKALRASRENLEYFQKQRAQLETSNLERRSEAEAVAGKMAGARVTVIRQAGESGQLYGSVSARDIAEALTEAGFTAERRQVEIDRAIKNLGLFEVRVALHPEVHITVMVNVARSPEEAQLQAQRGGMVTGMMAEEEPEEEEAEALPEPPPTEAAGPEGETTEPA